MLLKLLKYPSISLLLYAGILLSSANALASYDLEHRDPLFTTIPVEDEILDYSQHKEIKFWLDEMAKKYEESHGFSQEFLYQIFSKVRFQKKALLLNNPALKKQEPPNNNTHPKIDDPPVKEEKELTKKDLSWRKYRKAHLGSFIIKKGLEFFEEHKVLLAEVEEKYGVPGSIVVSTIGVETKYGLYIGKFPVFHTLASLAFKFHEKQRRIAFFNKELEHFLLLSQEQNWCATDSPDEWLLCIDERKGSYSGAMGIPQFLPSSYRDFAVDADEDGKIDLWSSLADIFYSVANYYEKHNWQKQMPVGYWVQVNGEGYKDLLKAQKKSKLLPEITYETFLDKEISIPDFPEEYYEMPLSFFEFPMHFPNESNGYWAGLYNFYVITRYNHSSFYAMSIYLLSQEFLL